MATERKNYGKRADGTNKGSGWLGEIRLPNGDVATEYSIGVGLGGQDMEIPTLVPTLTQEEVAMMRDDIIPNNKPIPDGIKNKAVAHARQMMSEGKSVWAPEAPATDEEKVEGLHEDAAQAANRTAAMYASKNKIAADNRAIAAMRAQDELAKQQRENIASVEKSLQDEEKTATDALLDYGKYVEERRKEDEAQAVADKRAARWTGLTELAASIANLIGVGANDASNQEYHSFSQDWMKRADMDARERRNRFQSIKERQMQMQNNLAALKAGNAKDLAALRDKAAAQRYAQRLDLADFNYKSSAENNAILAKGAEAASNLRLQGGLAGIKTKQTNEHLEQGRQRLGIYSRQQDLQEKKYNDSIDMSNYKRDKNGNLVLDEEKVKRNAEIAAKTSGGGSKSSGNKYDITIGNQRVVLDMSKENRAQAIKDGTEELKRDILHKAGLADDQWDDLVMAVSDKRKDRKSAKGKGLTADYSEFSDIIDAIETGTNDKDALEAIVAYVDEHRNELPELANHFVAVANGLTAIGSANPKLPKREEKEKEDPNDIIKPGDNVSINDLDAKLGF